jgi:hypothetical protein
MAAVLGKQELLAWASQTAGVALTTKYDELKDGYIFLCLCEKLWPASIDHHVVRAQKHGQRSTKLNWEVVRNVLGAAGLPLHLCDRKGVAAGHQRPCYNLLVMFYFLTKLQQSAEFSVDFAHPIDDQLAAFLQSPQSLACVGKGATNASTGAAALAVDADASGSFYPYTEDTTRSVSPAQPAPSPSRPRGTNGPNPSSTTPVPTPRTNADSSALASTPGSMQAAMTLVPRLRSEVHTLKKSKELLTLELQHVKQLSKLTLDQQRAQVESELSRAQEQFQTHLASLRMELHHQAEQASFQCFSDYNKVLDEIAMERNALVFDDRSVDALRAELLELRQLKHVLTGKSSMLEQELQRSKSHATHLKESLEQQRLTFDKLLRGFTGSISRLASMTNGVPQELLGESLSPAEQQPIVSKIAGQQMEIEALRARVQLLEHELAAGAGSNGGAAAGSSFDDVERARLLGQLERAKNANAFLSEQVAFVKSGGDTAVAGKDFKAQDLSHGVVVPSCSVGSIACDELCGDALKRLTQHRAAMPPEVYDAVRVSFMEVTLLVNVLRSRVDRGGSVIHALHAKLLDSNKQLLVDKHQSKKEINEVRHASQAKILDLAVQFQNQTEARDLALQLAQGEVAQLRAEHDTMARRLQELGSSVVEEIERVMVEPKERNSLLLRQVAALRAREQLMAQVIDAYKGLARSQPSDRSVHGAKVAAVSNQLSSAEPVPTAGGRSLDVAAEIKESMAIARVNVERTIAAIMAAERQEGELRDRLRQCGDELASLRQGSGSVQEDIRRLRAALEQAQQDAEQHSKESIESKARADSLEQTLQSVGSEMQRHLEEILKLKRPPTSPCAPLSTAAPPNVAAGPFSAPPAPAASQTPLVAMATHHSAGGSNSATASIPPPLHASAASAGASSGMAGQQQQGTAAPRSFTTASQLLQRSTNGLGSLALSSVPSSAIMTPEELERRKQEILSKYGVKK